MMKLMITLMYAFLSATAANAEVYNYSCIACIFPKIASDDGCDGVYGKTYPLRVDDSKHVLDWRGKKYSLREQPNCAKYGWHAENNETSFDFCIATQGYGAIEYNDEIRVRCDLKR